MRNSRPIEFVEVHSSWQMPKLTWWDKPRWWLVKLLGGQNPHEILRITRISIDTEDFLERLYKQQESLFRYFNKEATTLLIGAEDFEKLMGIPTISHYMSFRADAGWGNREILGLTIKVIPWMRGMVVMP